AILAVPRGQTGAAAALGLTHRQTLRWVVLPQALRAMLPPACNLMIELMKNSALVSLIAITELTFAAQLARSATLQSGLIFTLVLLFYFTVALGVTGGFRALERRLAVPGGHGR
ncbi:MAG: ABC transporter permease subunit, partial [Burkholderiales bacterium]|nr:ABC transporter permease subunit [Burkholderiales bacterium]